VVPLEANSGRVKERYAALGAPMTLGVPPRQGHNMWPGFFQCPELVEFVIANAGVGMVLDSPQDHQVAQRDAKNVFSGRGLREHASRWVEKVGPWLERQAAGMGR
jgi:hypothetical protein